MSKAIDTARQEANERANKEAASLPYCKCSCVVDSRGHVDGEGRYYHCQYNNIQRFDERCTKKDEQECPRLIRPKPPLTTPMPPGRIM